jgi:diacylglycerol kinase family enzyme
MEPVNPGAATPILVNDRAGWRGATWQRRLERLFRARGLPVDIRSVPPERIAEEASSAAAAGHPVVGVSGGDGTLASAAARLAGREVGLLAIPTGTLNTFSRRLGIAHPGDAARALAAGDTHRVPVGVMDDGIFLNTATFGLYADVVRRRESLRPLLSKWPAAAVAFLDVILRMRRLDATIQVQGEPLRLSTPVLWVGVGWGSFPRVIHARERRSSPDLEIVVLEAGSRAGAISLALRLGRHLLFGERPIREPGFRVMHARSLVIQASRPIGVTLDGEVTRVMPPVFVGIVDDALRVVSLAGDEGRGAEEEEEEERLGEGQERD